MSTFYMTYAGRTYPNDIIPWAEKHQVPIMTNVSDRWSEAKQSLLDMFEYDTRRTIDSAGFNSQGRYIDQYGNLRVEESVIEDERASDAPFFPWTVEQYHSWLADHAGSFEWAATMDYACEDRFNPLWSVEDRIESTIDNTVAHFERDPDYDLVPVLQGRSVDDYLYCYERLEEADVHVPLDRVGLGTVCRISSEKQIVEMEKEVNRRLPNYTKVHGFGVKVSAFKLGSTFDTADSHAWVAEPKRGRVALLEKDGNGLRMQVEDMDHARRRTLETFKTYYAYVSSLMGSETNVDVDDIIDGQDTIRESLL